MRAVSFALCLLTMLAMSAAPAFARVQVNEFTNIDLYVYIPCTGHTVELKGPLHILISYTENRNHISGKFHYQPQGIAGTDVTTGDRYRATGVTQESFQTSLQNGHAGLTYVNNFRIIGQGPGNNYLVHETMHVTFNAAGIVSVYFDNFSAECK